MKYGVLSFLDWEPRVEGYPDGTYVIVLLENSGEIHVDSLMTSANQGQSVGVGTVYSSDRRVLGYVPIPISGEQVTVHGAFDGMADAWEYAESLRSDQQATEDKVNAALQLNDDIDWYLDFQAHKRRVQFLTVLIIVIAVAIIIGVYIMRRGV